MRQQLQQLHDTLQACTLCPKECRVNRREDEPGFCRIGLKAKVTGWGPHFGEEPVLVGKGGSGAIFFAGCNLGCVFCQNYEISRNLEGEECSSEQLAQVMLNLQEQGCHNINLVTPSQVTPQIVAALEPARSQGLHLPLVYNSSGYDSPETLRLLDGLIDIYLPDFKFWEPASAKRFLKAEDYPEVARAALLEMHRQVGDLIVDEHGIARRGLLVRHLVMPESLDETEAILSFLACEVSANTTVNVMEQYHPCGRAQDFPPLDRALNRDEYQRAVSLAHGLDLRLVEPDLEDLLRQLFS